MNLSRFGRFTVDELDHLSVWETPGLFDEHGTLNPQHLEEVAQAPALTVEEVEAMQQQAYDEAFQQGKRDGFAEGYEEGLIRGKESGQELGYQEGSQQGQQEGYDEAIAKGTHETHELQKQHAAQFLSLLEALNEPFKRLDARVEKQLVDLAIAIASHLVRRELKLDPGEVIAVVRAAVNVLPVAAQNITLHLHPADAELVKSALALTHTITSWNIVENPIITQGGCKVMTDVSYVDATVEKRLAAVIAMVLGGGREEDAAEEDMDIATEVTESEEEDLEALVQGTDVDDIELQGTNSEAWLSEADDSIENQT